MSNQSTSGCVFHDALHFKQAAEVARIFRGDVREPSADGLCRRCRSMYRRKIEPKLVRQSIVTFKPDIAGEIYVRSDCPNCGFQVPAHHPRCITQVPL